MLKIVLVSSFSDFVWEETTGILPGIVFSSCFA